MPVLENLDLAEDLMDFYGHSGVHIPQRPAADLSQQNQRLRAQLLKDHRELGKQIQELRDLMLKNCHAVIKKISALEDKAAAKASIPGEVNNETDTAKTSLDDSITRPTEMENALIRRGNKLRTLADATVRLIPLRDIHTGSYIPNCPRTIADIHQMSEAEAMRILLCLGLPVSVAQKRAAVLEQFVEV